MMKNFFLSIVCVFACSIPLQPICLPNDQFSSFSSSDETTSYAHVDMEKKRIWILVDSPFWENYIETGSYFIYLQSTIGDDSVLLTPLTGRYQLLFYFDIPFDAISYRFALVKNDGVTIEIRTRASLCYETDNSYLHVIDGDSSMNSLLNPASFSKNLLTPECINSFLEGYFPYRSNPTNGYNAFPLIKKNVLDNYGGDQELLNNVFHWTVDSSGEEKYLSAKNSVILLSDAYETENSLVLMSFGGTKGFVLACLLLLGFISFLFFFLLSKKTN